MRSAWTVAWAPMRKSAITCERGWRLVSHRTHCMSWRVPHEGQTKNSGRRLRYSRHVLPARYRASELEGCGRIPVSCRNRSKSSRAVKWAASSAYTASEMTVAPAPRDSLRACAEASSCGASGITTSSRTFVSTAVINAHASGGRARRGPAPAGVPGSPSTS